MKLLNNKMVQAVLAVGPAMLFVFFFIGYVAFIISAFEGIYQNGNPWVLSGDPFQNFNLFLIASFSVSALFIFATIYFVLHAAQNPLLEKENMRLIWILLIIFLTGIGNFIYWLLEIRNKTPRPVIGSSTGGKKTGNWSGGLYMKN